VKIKLPATVKAVLDGLHAKGYEAYAVGGCIRDSVLGRRPDDWDITTSALPRQVKEIFGRTVDTGIAHGTVTVLLGSKAHEVTTYRIDGEYGDGRHPDQVTFTASLAEDLKRRDFTVNAMAYNEEEGLIDLCGGMEDLQKKLIRCVGDPMERFSEDALRILRAVRFSAQLNFGIDRETLAGIIRLAPTLEKISAERICTELLKLIGSDHPDYLKVAYEAGITKIILPEFDAMMQTPQNNPYHCFGVGDHTLKSMCAIEAGRITRLAMLLHDVGKPLCRTTDEAGIDHFKEHGPLGAELAGKIMRRLKLDNDTIRKVKELVRYHDWRIQPEEKQVRRAVNRIGEELFPILLKIQNADMLAQDPKYMPQNLQRIIGVTACYEKIIREKQCISLKDLQVTGADILELGCKPGPEVGKLLRLALEEVLEDPGKNDRTWLMEFLRAKTGENKGRTE
jgi:tRNA nucleotidyltransferase (CCA-adding enzyme)